jgi:hypothetical protein
MKRTPGASRPRRALILCSILAMSTPLIAGCAGTTSRLYAVAAINCLDLIPDDYKTPVQGVPPLRPGATVGDQGEALDGQTRNLSIANGHTAGAVHIVGKCDEANEKLRQALKPKKRFRWF